MNPETLLLEYENDRARFRIFSHPESVIRLERRLRLSTGEFGEEASEEFYPGVDFLNWLTQRLGLLDQLGNTCASVPGEEVVADLVLHEVRVRCFAADFGHLGFPNVRIRVETRDILRDGSEGPQLGNALSFHTSVAE